jgi:selenide,water dikinase
MGVFSIKLTEYSHGAGCGCKISPKILSEILSSTQAPFKDANLLVGYETKDDAAVYAIDNERVIISTTDFFMPIVDNPFDFGGIASVNAISDVYAMGGKPLLAIAILGFPVNKLPAEVAQQILEGARNACAQAGIAIAGGHSIDAPEPIFGLAVTGMALKNQIRTNSSATEGCELYLTKPLGVGIITTAQKKGVVKDEDLQVAKNQMLELNRIGEELGQISSIKSMTDVTGFGLLGHLIEMCEGSGLSAEIDFKKVPILDCLPYYLDKKTFPGGTQRNFESYGFKVNELSDLQKTILCDPQTSGGLLVAVEPEGKKAFEEIAKKYHKTLIPFGRLIAKKEKVVYVI